MLENSARHETILHQVNINNKTIKILFFKSSCKINLFHCYIDTFRSYYHPLGHQAKLLLCAGAGRGNGGSHGSRGEAAAVPWSPGRSLANTRTPRSAGGVRARTAQVPDTTPRMRTLVHTSLDGDSARYEDTVAAGTFLILWRVNLKSSVIKGSGKTVIFLCERKFSCSIVRLWRCWQLRQLGRAADSVRTTHKSDKNIAH